MDRVKKCGVESNRMQDLHIEVRAHDIVVTMPGTSLRVVYRRPHRGSQLVARLDYFQDQQKGPITRAEFLDRPLKAANDNARKLGWIVRSEAAHAPRQASHRDGLSELNTFTGV